jgi:hypothetical protein
MVMPDCRCSKLAFCIRAAISDQHRKQRDGKLTLDDVQRLRDGNGRDGSSNRGDKVLRPGRRGVVLQAEDIVFREGRSAKKGKGAGCVPEDGPGRARIQLHAFVG